MPRRWGTRTLGRRRGAAQSSRLCRPHWAHVLNPANVGPAYPQPGRRPIGGSIMIDQMTMAYARRALNEAVRGWLFDPGVRLIDFGYRQRAGQFVEDELCIRLHTKEKYTLGPVLQAAVEAGRTRGAFPKKIGDFAVDVIQADYRTHQWWNW